MSDTGTAKKPAIALTPGSHVRVRSAGPDDQAIDSVGRFRGLVSIGGDNTLAIELDGGEGEEKGRIRLVPVPALLAVDILEAAKPEEEKRNDSSQAAAYFR
ncbi:MAG: hypothetical protein L3K10_01610 [Thermoplasmata archaeon]|jgi:hypothetical protein|nr:hypothetical protein [Thermoplasmata archaeon]